MTSTATTGPPDQSERLGFVAMDGEQWVGVVTGLAPRKTSGYANWFRITDAFVEEDCRGRGVGRKLLRRLEDKLVSLDIENVWIWCASYYAGFFAKQGFEIFCEMDQHQASGHSMVGLRKNLQQ